MHATLLFFNLVVYPLYFHVPSFFMLFLFLHHSSVIKCIHFTCTRLPCTLPDAQKWCVSFSVLGGMGSKISYANATT